MNMKKQDIEMA